MSTIAALMILGPVNVGAVECLYSDTTAAFPPPPSNSLIGGFDFTQTYPDFCSVFYVIIDPAIVAAWDSVGIAQFIELVMDADTTNADDVFPAVWDYFLLEGADSNSAYARVEYTVNGFPLTQIGISIENKLGSSYQGGGGVHLGAQGKDPMRWREMALLTNCSISVMPQTTEVLGLGSTTNITASTNRYLRPRSRCGDHGRSFGK